MRRPSISPCSICPTRRRAHLLAPQCCAAAARTLLFVDPVPAGLADIVSVVVAIAAAPRALGLLRCAHIIVIALATVGVGPAVS